MCILGFIILHLVIKPNSMLYFFKLIAWSELKNTSRFFFFWSYAVGRWFNFYFYPFLYFILLLLKSSIIAHMMCIKVQIFDKPFQIARDLVIKKKRRAKSSGREKINQRALYTLNTKNKALASVIFVNRYFMVIIIRWWFSH